MGMGHVRPCDQRECRGYRGAVWPGWSSRRWSWKRLRPWGKQGAGEELGWEELDAMEHGGRRGVRAMDAQERAPAARVGLEHRAGSRRAERGDRGRWRSSAERHRGEPREKGSRGRELAAQRRLHWRTSRENKGAGREISRAGAREYDRAEQGAERREMREDRAHRLGIEERLGR
ncbi:uncharacterized protein [Zea mays]|uniref:Uncharacterized protein n=1 Tax=Zea mays TaxID=4577 RepID=A0A804LSY1_MAIZE|nr:uncharacterized protein LOC109943477 [Zea mays]|eukprot:XP_020402178.1 uncharacterized protein LOC109943477 [Zea mays]